jgi:hypothetical protein
MKKLNKINLPLGIILIVLGIARVFSLFNNFNQNELIISVLCITLGVKQLENYYMYKKLMILLKRINYKK